MRWRPQEDGPDSKFQSSSRDVEVKRRGRGRGETVVIESQKVLEWWR